MTRVHQPPCEGGHLDDISCADVTRLRADIDANPWYCRGATTSGYHLFDAPWHEDPPLDAQCRYESCDRTWGELKKAEV